MPGVVEKFPGASISALAGKPASKEMLVDLARLELEHEKLIAEGVRSRVAVAKKLLGR